MESKETLHDVEHGNIKYLNEYLKNKKLYYKINLKGDEYEVDNNESITPTTDKGYFNFTDAIEKLSKLTPLKQHIISEDTTLQNEGNKTVILPELEGKSLAKYENEIFVKKYQYKDSETSKVLRFGINADNIDDLPKKLLEYNNHLRSNLDTYGKYLDKMSNISKETNYQKFVKAIQPTDIENTLVKNAIEYLNITGSKTVLVDLFPRVLNSNIDNAPVGTIKIEQKIETHTALLYNTGKNILVIDPNNPQFSAFLQNMNPSYIQSSYRADDKIYTRGGESGPDSWRDCIDIAVKLAFVLNNSKNTYTDIKSIIESPEIKLITNNPIFDENIFYSEKMLVREKQTSSKEQVVLFNENLKHKANLFNKQQDFLNDAKDHADKKLLNMFEEALLLNENISMNDFNDKIPNCFFIGEDNPNIGD